MSDEQKAIYDQELIQRGLLLPLQKPGPKVKENPFAAVAMELFTTEDKPGYDSDQDTDGKLVRKKSTKKKSHRKKKP